MRHKVVRLLMLGMMVPVAILTSGCPQGSGEQISLSTSTLDFGLTQTTLTFDVTNSGSFFTTAQFEVVPQSIPWVASVNPTSGQSFALGFGGGAAVTVTVTIDRNNLAPGVVSTGIIIVGPTSPESSATPQVLTVRATGEGVVEEGEGTFEGEGEGTIEGTLEGEGEGVVEGEGEEPIVCPEPCEISFCLSSGIDAGVQLALQTLLDLPILGQNSATADLDNNGILDIAHGNLVDIVLANSDLPIHCCVLDAWLNNEELVLAALDAYDAETPEGENIVSTIGRDVIEPVFIGLATIGERNTQNVLQNIIDTLEIDLDASLFDLSARKWLASTGDTDLDGVCNLAEFRGANQDPFGFILAAIDPDVTINGGGCGLPCYTNGGEGEGGVDGEGGGGDGEGDDEGVGTDVLCVVNMSQAQVNPPSGSAATGTATFSLFEGQVLLVVEHTVPDAVSIGIFQGGPGTTGQLFIPLQSAVSPSFILLSPAQYAVIDSGYYVQVNSTSRPGGAIRGDINCDGAEEGEAEVEEGEGEGVVEGTEEGEGQTEGEGEGVTEGEGEGTTEGQEGEEPIRYHSADYAPPLGRITLSELIRGIQFFNLVTGAKGIISAGEYGCAQQGDPTDEGFVPGGPVRDCEPHDLDFAPQDWRITLAEVLRLIQIYNSTDGAYFFCNQGEDGYCLGVEP